MELYRTAANCCPPPFLSYRHAGAEAIQQEYVETMELFQKTTENIKKERKALSVRKQVLASTGAFVTCSMRSDKSYDERLGMSHKICV